MKSNKIVTNMHGYDINFDAACMMMDDDLREEMHREDNWTTDQEFFDAYVDRHFEKFGEDWELSKANPTW